MCPLRILTWPENILASYTMLERPSDCPQAHSSQHSFSPPVLLIHVLYMSLGCMEGGFWNVCGKTMSLMLHATFLQMPVKGIKPYQLARSVLYCNANLNPLLAKHIQFALAEQASGEATTRLRCCDFSCVCSGEEASVTITHHINVVTSDL